MTDLDKLKVFIKDFKHTRDNARLTFSGKQLFSLCEAIEGLITAYNEERILRHKAEKIFADRLKSVLCIHDEDYEYPCICPSYLEAEIDQLLLEGEPDHD